LDPEKITKETEEKQKSLLATWDTSSSDDMETPNLGNLLNEVVSHVGDLESWEDVPMGSDDEGISEAQKPGEAGEGEDIKIQNLNI